MFSGSEENEMFSLYCVSIFRIAGIICLILCATSGNALAVQIHGPPEGIYVHQMAHDLFAAAMIFLIYTLHRHPLVRCPGWKYLKISLFFFLLWNINALTVHSLSLHLPEHAITGTNLLNQRLQGPLTWERWLYYITRNDHLLCVPAMWFMMRFLKTFYHEAVNDSRDSEVCTES